MERRRRLSSWAGEKKCLSDDDTSTLGSIMSTSGTRGKFLLLSSSSLLFFLSPRPSLSSLITSLLPSSSSSPTDHSPHLLLSSPPFPRSKRKKNVPLTCTEVWPPIHRHAKWAPVIAPPISPVRPPDGSVDGRCKQVPIMRGNHAGMQAAGLRAGPWDAY